MFLRGMVIFAIERITQEKYGDYTGEALSFFQPCAPKHFFPKQHLEEKSFLSGGRDKRE